MTVGVPGTGIGGLFYILLALWMPFHEARLALTGRGGRTRWRTIVSQSGMAWSILAAMWGEAWLLRHALVWVVSHTPGFSWWHAASAAALPLLIPVAGTWFGLAILGGVILATHVLRLRVRTPQTLDGRRSKPRSPAQVPIDRTR